MAEGVTMKQIKLVNFQTQDGSVWVNPEYVTRLWATENITLVAMNDGFIVELLDSLDSVVKKLTTAGCF